LEIWNGNNDFVHGNLIFLPGLALSTGYLSDDAIGYEKQSDDEEKFRIHLSYSEVSRIVLGSVTPNGSALGCSVVALLNPKLGAAKLSNSN
jgi:hypothetical protein